MSTPEERDRILKRIRQLAALADAERNPSAKEAEAAAIKMQQMMDQYNVGWSEVLLNKTEQEQKKSFGRYETVHAFGATKRWQWGLARIIASITSTKYFTAGAYGDQLIYRGGKKLRNASVMCFFGGEEAGKLACDLYDEWVVTLDQMAQRETGVYCQELTDKYGVDNPIPHWRQVRAAAREHGDVLYEEDHPLAWRKGWLEGVIAGIDHALYEERKARTQPAAKPNVRRSKLVEDEPEEDENTPTGDTTADQGAPEADAVQISTALTVITTALEAAYTDYSKHFRKLSTSSSSASHYGAYEKGRSVGTSIRIGSKKIGG